MRSKGTAATQGINGDAAILQRWLGAVGLGDGSLAPCSYDRHRPFDWTSRAGLVQCGICHPPAAEIVRAHVHAGTLPG